MCNSVIGFCFFSLPRATKLITDFHFVELRCGLVTEADPLDRSDSPAIDRSLQKRLMQLRWNSNFPKALSVDLWRPLLSISGFRRKPWVLCRVAIGLSLSSRFFVLNHKNLITCFRLDRRKKIPFDGFVSWSALIEHETFRPPTKYISLLCTRLSE